MGGEELWWEWTVPSHDSSSNENYTLLSPNFGNDSYLVYNAFNLSGNGSWLGEFSLTGKFEILLTVFTATVLGSIILLTIVGE